MFAKAIGWGLYKNRAFVGRIPFAWLKPAEEIGITLASDDNEYPIPATVYNAHELDLGLIAQETERQWKEGRARFAKMKSHALLGLLPPPLMQVALLAAGYLS